MSGFGEASFASARLERKGWAGCVREWQAGERFGWLVGLWHGRLLYGLFMLGRRVMVRLRAVLCGSVMYGLVCLAW